MPGMSRGAKRHIRDIRKISRMSRYPHINIATSAYLERTSPWVSATRLSRQGRGSSRSGGSQNPHSVESRHGRAALAPLDSSDNRRGQKGQALRGRRRGGD